MFDTCYESITAYRDEQIIDVHEMTASTFLVQEQGTYLFDIYEKWAGAGEETESGFQLPHHMSFLPERILTPPQRDLYSWIGVGVFQTNNDEVFVKDFLGKFTFATALSVKTFRKPQSLRVTWKDKDEIKRFTRLFLPVVDDQDTVIRIDIIDRHEGPTMRLVESERMGF